MHPHTLFTQLLAVEPTDPTSSTFHVSIYIPTENTHLPEIETRVSSALTEALRNHAQLAQPSEMHHALRTAVSAAVQELEQYGNGLALFFTFSFDDKRQLLKKAPTEIHTALLIHVPQKEVYIGSVFSLGQLAQAVTHTHTATALTLSQDTADIYHLTDNELTHIQTFTTIYEVPEADEYRERRTPTANKHAYFGTGSDKMQRRHETEAQLFSNAIRARLKSTPRLVNGDSDFIIFYSDSLTNSIDKFATELRREHPIHQVHTVAQLPPTEQAVRDAARKIIHDHIQKQQKESMDTAVEKFAQLATGWTEVTEADQNKQIATLFIDPTASYSGYILDKNLVFTERVPDSVPVANITPWLVRNTLQTGGSVIIQDPDTTTFSEQVAAELRYTP